METVPHPKNCLNINRFGRVWFDLAAQVAYVDVDGAFDAFEGAALQFDQQIGARKDPPRGGHQDVEQVKL